MNIQPNPTGAATAAGTQKINLRIHQMPIHQTMGSAEWLLSQPIFAEFKEIDACFGKCRIATFSVLEASKIVASDGCYFDEYYEDWVPSRGIHEKKINWDEPQDLDGPIYISLTPAAREFIDQMVDRVCEEFRLWIKSDRNTARITVTVDSK